MCTLVFLRSDPCLFGAWLHEQLFDICFIFFLYNMHFQPYSEDRIINLFTGFVKMFVTVLSECLTHKTSYILWIKSIYTCFTDGRMILRATRKICLLKCLVIQSDSPSYATWRCQRPVLIAFSCSWGLCSFTASLLSGTWKNVSCTSWSVKYSSNLSPAMQKLWGRYQSWNPTLQGSF